MASSDDQPLSNADKIRAELEALGAKNRQPTASAHSAPLSPGRWRHFALWAIAALAVNATVVGVLHYSLNNPPVYPPPPVIETPMEIVDAPPLAPEISLAEPIANQQPAEPVQSVHHPVSRVGTIVVNGQTHTYEIDPAASQYTTAYNTYTPQPVVVNRPYRPRSTRPVVVVQPAPATSGATTSTPAAPSAATHAAVAKEYAYQHFRYSYKVGSNNYEVTSLNITTTGTSEVPGWGTRHRTTGTAGLSYYANDGFKRTTRKFEVLTEVQNGQITATGIDVKY